MRAYVLAAGLGSRLRPITDTVPKCLVPIAGRPLLEYWLDLLAFHGVDRILLNSHHLHDPLLEFVRKQRGPIEITVAHEPVLLGSAGTLIRNRDFVAGAEEFLVIYADNLTDASLTPLIEAHRRARPAATLGLFKTAEPERCGIVELGNEGAVTHFEEKPVRPRSALAFAGILAASPAIFDFIPVSTPSDIGRDVLPRMVGRMKGVELRGYLRDIGTLESYRQAQADAPSLRIGAR